MSRSNGTRNLGDRKYNYFEKIICGKVKLSRMKLTTESSSLGQDVRKTSQND